jgi:hypothetical protein
VGQVEAGVEVRFELSGQVRASPKKKGKQKMTTKKQNRNSSDLRPHAEAKRAFARVRERMEALPPESLVQIKVDVPHAVGIVIAAEPRIARLIPEMAHLPGFSVEHVRDLRDLGLAAWYAHVSYQPDAADASVVSRLAEEALPLRRSLKQQARAFAALGLIEADKVAAIRGRNSHRDLGRNLVELVVLFEKARKDVRVKKSELERAANVGTQLVLALGAQEAKIQGAVEPSKAADARLRAFELLRASYDEVRRAVTYLRWREGDADAIAPSLYSPSRRRRRAAAENSEPPPQPPVTAPVATPT